MKIGLNYLVVSVGQQCNLRCKHCANFAPFTPKELRRYPIENIIADFEALFKVVGKINLLQIQGGEPLVYSDLPKLTSYLSACEEIGEIVIATNGMLTPSDENMHQFSVNKIKFRISNYPQNRENLERFVAKAQTYRVDIRLYDFASKESLWFDCGDVKTSREDDDAIVAERFYNCAFNSCLTLENGELHRCSRSTNAYKLQNFTPLPGDFVKIRNNEWLNHDLFAYLSNPHFETSCRYCNGTHLANKIPVAEQL